MQTFVFAIRRFSLGIVIWSVVYHQMPWADRNVEEVRADELGMHAMQ